ncbi:MAG: polysaccharide deacetylase family protein [Flavobacteriaceae bacterium]
MKAYFVKTPKIVRSFYKNYTWFFKTNKKEIYLTFDDGPTENVTQFVLDALEKHQAKATFFCIGKNVENQPLLYQRIVKNGHTIGNHTYNHLNGWQTNANDYVNNVEKCADAINSTFNNQKIFRPPYGRIKKYQAKQLIKKGYEIIMWSVLSGDFDTTISKEKCLKNVLDNTKKGSIIVFHDSIKAKQNIEYVLPKVLEYFSKKGYSFVAL